MTHLRYVGWPDFDVPTSPAPLLELLREWFIFQGQQVEPSVIHCSAGVGRTGVFAALICIYAILHAPMRAVEVVAKEHYTHEVSGGLSSLVQLTLNSPTPNQSISVQNIVMNLRKQRNAKVVQTSVRDALQGRDDPILNSRLPLPRSNTPLYIRLMHSCWMRC